MKTAGRRQPLCSRRSREAVGRTDGGSTPPCRHPLPTTLECRENNSSDAVSRRRPRLSPASSVIVVAVLRSIPGRRPFGNAVPVAHAPQLPFEVVAASPVARRNRHRLRNACYPEDIPAAADEAAAAGGCDAAAAPRTAARARPPARRRSVDRPRRPPCRRRPRSRSRNRPRRSRRGLTTVPLTPGNMAPCRRAVPVDGRRRHRGAVREMRPASIMATAVGAGQPRRGCRRRHESVEESRIS